MDVFITGATGFVGLNIIDALLEAGHRPIALVRRNSNLKYLERFQVELREGSLDDVKSLRICLRGAASVIHCAGQTSGHKRHAEELTRTNVRGTSNLVDAALAEGIRRFVYTSTTSTIGHSMDSRERMDENSPLRGFRMHSLYAASKTEGERIVIGAAGRGLEPIILNPAEVLGAWDHNLQWGRMVVAVAKGQTPFIPTGSGSFCHAQEVGRAHVAALTRGRVGTRYILAGTDVGFEPLIRVIASISGTSIRAIRYPYPLLFIAMGAMSWASPFTGIDPPLDLHRLRMFYGHHLFSSARAESELGFRPRTIEEMVTASYGWYRKEGIL